jgi:hypothetical protein
MTFGLRAARSNFAVGICQPVGVTTIELDTTLGPGWACLRFYEIPARDWARQWLIGGTAKSSNPEFQALLWRTSAVGRAVDLLECRTNSMVPRHSPPAANTPPSHLSPVMS